MRNSVETRMFESTTEYSTIVTIKKLKMIGMIVTIKILKIIAQFFCKTPVYKSHQV